MLQKPFKMFPVFWLSENPEMLL